MIRHGSGMTTRLIERPENLPGPCQPRAFLICVIICLLLAQGVAAAPLFVAADDSDPVAKAQADYICDGVNDQVEIQAAFAALPDGGVVALSRGTFNCSGSLIPPAGATLRGEGPDETSLLFHENGRLNISEERITLDGFHIAGSNYTDMSTETWLDLGRWLGVLTIYASHAKVHNVTGTADASIQAVFLLLHNPNIYAPILEDIEFIDCRAEDTGTYGFLHNAWGSENTTIKDIRYENCTAINCGRYGAFNAWVTGFDFAEQNNIEGLRVNNCSASGSLESGFHFEWDAKKHDCVFINCVSTDNGHKPWPETYLVGDPDYFGAGFYLPGGQVSLVNCRAEGNGAFGFFIGNPGGMLLYNCTENGTGRFSAAGGSARPIAYCILQSLPVTKNPSIVMDHCSSLGTNGWGLFVCGAANMLIRGFTMIDPAGIGGIGAMLGCPASELPVNSTIGVGISNSTIDLVASGDRPQTLVYIVDNRNVTYSGRIISGATHPVLVGGSMTGDVDLSALRVLSANDTV